MVMKMNSRRLLDQRSFSLFGLEYVEIEEIKVIDLHDSLLLLLLLLLLLIPCWQVEKEKKGNVHVTREILWGYDDDGDDDGGVPLWNSGSS
jgi:hypothetical protein